MAQKNPNNFRLFHFLYSLLCSRFNHKLIMVIDKLIKPGPPHAEMCRIPFGSITASILLRSSSLGGKPVWTTISIYVKGFYTLALIHASPQLFITEVHRELLRFHGLIFVLTYSENSFNMYIVVCVFLNCPVNSVWHRSNLSCLDPIRVLDRGHTLKCHSKHPGYFSK